MMVILDSANSISKMSRFLSMGTAECFIVAEAPTGMNFTDSLRTLLSDYEEYLRRHGLGKDTEIHVRFYFSDICNQVEYWRRYLRFAERDRGTFYSCVGQPPASGSKISLAAYHVKSDAPVRKTAEAEDRLCVHHGPYRSVWMHNRPRTANSSYEQTKEIFQNLSYRLDEFGGTVENNVFRTWCYIRDIDNNYRGFVKAREDFFRSIGLTKDTHTIASTGIEGDSAEAADLVAVESLAILGLKDAQVEYMHALNHLCPTHDYNVSFERATRIMFGDRSHYYISGTASIDRKGRVVHEGSVIKQADRVLENIRALLKPYGGELENMCSLTVYLRDPADYKAMRAFLDERFPAGMPYSIVQGAVCRPSWLVEMDGIAISNEKDEQYAPFVKD